MQQDTAGFDLCVPVSVHCLLPIDVETSDGIPAQHVQLLAPGSVLPALEPLLAFPRKPIVKADHVADPCDFRTVGPIMKFVRLVPMQNRMDGDTLVAGGFGFFGDAAWPSLQTSAPSDELRELVPTAQRKVKSKKPLRPWMFDGDVVDDATGVEEKKDAAVEVEEPVEDDDDDPDDAACVPEDERIAEEEGFQPFFKMPASSTDAIDLASSLTIELAFVNFLRKVCLCLVTLGYYHNTQYGFLQLTWVYCLCFPAYLHRLEAGTSFLARGCNRTQAPDDSLLGSPRCEALDP